MIACYQHKYACGTFTILRVNMRVYMKYAFISGSGRHARVVYIGSQMLHMKWLEKHFTMFKMRFARSDIHLVGRLDYRRDRVSTFCIGMHTTGTK
jgi:hypothetical protein